MFRKMRRTKQRLSKATTQEILRNGVVGVLGVLGDDDYPYAVPVNYAYEDGKIYFHSAKAGHKLDAIQRHSKVSFCVIDKDEVVPAELTSFFRSAIAFGKASIVSDDALKQHGLELLARKYSPGFEELGAESIRKEWKNVCVVEIVIDHLTGKEAIELVNARLKSGDGRED
jgi:uncharacterized protein